MAHLARRRLIVAVAVLALLALAPAGSALAGNKPGNSPNAKLCQKGGWMNYTGVDGIPFASEEACTSYAAHGGTLYPPFQPTCQSFGGTYLTSFFWSPLSLSPACIWNGVDHATWNDAFNALHCPGAPYTSIKVGGWDPDVDPNVIGCM